jgi:chromosome segregation protein
VQERLAEARETRARNEARLEAARERRSELARAIRDQLDCMPEACLALAGLKQGEALPPVSEVEARLIKLKGDRERLGGVNLRAEAEEAVLAAQLEEMEREKADVEEAIQRLRQGIANLNREGRKRLLEAFDTVNGHFGRLFKTLFGGGSAELKLVDSDDPLESGLEIFACPPGKRPQALTLLSGGEKALTALALIFAVFLTNPSPICVLDEVDAPLDDSNVDRFCMLMEKMAADTATRFLVITHHPMTMARMNRLFGVTMGEKGVSQLVSVDLETAQSFTVAA